MGGHVSFLLLFDFLWSSCTLQSQLLRWAITFYSMFFHDLVFFICMGLSNSRVSTSGFIALRYSKTKKLYRMITQQDAFLEDVALSCFINPSKVTRPNKMLYKTQFHCSTNLVFSDILNDSFCTLFFNQNTEFCEIQGQGSNLKTLNTQLCWT
jgi:hypothetical protein